MLEDRKTGIGGSDIAAIMGLSPWKTAMDVWLEKRGEATAKPSSEEAVYWGTVLEDIVAREYQTRTSRKVQRVNKILRHPVHSFVIGHIDRAVINPEIAGRVRESFGRLTTDRILECKTANQFSADQWGEPGTDQVPDHYILQCQWYLEVTGADICDLAVLIGGQDFRIYTIQRDSALIAKMIDAAARFWKLVQDGIAPPPVTLDDAARRWPRHTVGKSAIVDVDVANACEELRRLQSEIRAMEQRGETLKAKIMAAFGDAEEITHQGRRLATWKTQVSTRIDAKRLREEMPEVAERYSVTTESRVFRLAR